MIVYFLRHGKAGQPRATNDDARELTPKGEAALRAAGPLWRRLTVQPDVVISSPLPRALRTAELFVEGIGQKESPVVDDRLRPGASWSDMAAALADHPNADSVMFVGHDPDQSRAVAELTGAASVRMRKGALAALEFDRDSQAGHGVLTLLLDPDLYGEDD